MISQFFILSPRGDVIIRRDYLGNVPKGSTEIFFRNARSYRGTGVEAPPVFLVDGVSYLHIKDGGVQLVACTRDNVSPSFVLEFLKRIATIIKDYCGSLSEDAIRRNFVLIYELLDEACDYGTPQSTATEALKQFVLNEPTVVAPPTGLKPLFGLQKGPTGVFKSVLDTARTDGRRRDEVFVDVVERLSVTFSAGGSVVAAQVDGAVQVKSYLAGNPPIKIKLNDDLLIARRDAAYGGGAGFGAGGAGFGGISAADYAHDARLVVLDDAYFHEAADLSAFETERAISLVPPDGEFALLNYRTSHGISPPFRLAIAVEPDPASELKAVVALRLFSDVPPDKAASGLDVEVPLPRYVQRVHCDLDARLPPGAQAWEFVEKTHTLRWRFKKLQGGIDCSLRARLTLEKPYGASLRTEVGPVNLRFTLPMYCASRLSLKYLQVLKHDKAYSPQRWVRYVTSSSSYVFRT